MAVAPHHAVLALVLAVQAAASFGTIGLPALAPLLRADLGLTLTGAGSLVSAFYVGSLLIGTPSGYLADRVGVRAPLVVGQLMIAASLAALSTADRAALVPVCIVAAGFGFALVNPISTKAVIAWAPPASRATAVGIKQTGLPLGGALGAWLLPELAQAVGWRGAVRTAAVAAAGAALLTGLLYRERRESRAASAGGAAPGGLARVLRDRNVWLVAVVTTFYAAVQTSWTGYLVLFLTESVGRALRESARVLAVANVAGMVGRITFGALSDRLFGGRRRVVLALAGLGSGLLALATALVGPGTPAAAIVVLALLFGWVGIGWNGVQLTLLAELAGRRQAGTAVGLGLAVSALGVILGPPAFGWLVERGGGYRPAWLALGALMALALLLLWRVREPERRE